MPIEVNANLTIPDAELEWRFTPSGGPGGQRANRSNTRVELTWSASASAVPSEGQRRRIVSTIGPTVRVVVDDERSQARNREIAQTRLADKVAEALIVPKNRRATRPTAGSRRRRVADKRRTSEKKRLRRPPRQDD